MDDKKIEAAATTAAEDKPELDLWDIEDDLDRVGADGVWRDYSEKVRVRVGSVESPIYQKCFQLMHESLREKYKNRAVPEEVAEDAFNQVYADAIVRDWVAPEAFTRENVVRMLARKRRFKAWVVAVANSRQTFTAALEEEAAKNSSTATSGASNGVAVESNSKELH